MDNDLKNTLLDSFKVNLISYGNNLEAYSFNFKGNTLEILGLPYYNKYKKLPILKLESVANFKGINRSKSFSTPVYYANPSFGGQIQMIKINANYLILKDSNNKIYL